MGSVFFGSPCTTEVLGIVSSAMSFKMEVNKDMGSSGGGELCVC